MRHYNSCYILFVFGCVLGLALCDEEIQAPSRIMVTDYISFITEHCKSRHSIAKAKYNECFKAEKPNLHYNSFTVIGECNDLLESEKTDVDLICAHVYDVINYSFFECIVNKIKSETKSDGKEALKNSRALIEKCVDRVYPKE